MDKTRYELVFESAAEEDIDAIMYSYEQKRKGLGIDFFVQLQNKLPFLQLNPLLYQTHFAHFRKVKVSRFPYYIHYTVLEEKKEVLIVAIWHEKRNPDDFIKRVRR